MKTMKIYGMRGLLEWHGTLDCPNGIKLKVDFTNGSTTSYGVAPATFITKDVLTQNLIESSEQFKGGRIRLERSVPLPGENDDEIVVPAVEAAAPKGAGAEQVEEMGEPAEAAAEETAEVGNGDGPQTIKVADKSEAVEWLKEHYPEAGYTGVKLRTMAQVNEAGKKHGVVFEIAG